MVETEGSKRSKSTLPELWVDFADLLNCLSSILETGRTDVLLCRVSSCFL